ncbi:MAG: DNA starvation/stationary phase protection protein [Lewinella sp.]|nr:DNA starvation/stationary phase protection protein [Lewinella sp.]
MNYLGMDKSKVKATVEELNTLLANYHLYYQNLRNFHWNIQGEHFLDLHEKFEQLYDDARLKIDEIAERILTLRMRPLSQFSDYLDRAEVKEAGKVEEDVKMVSTILENHRILIENMRNTLDAADEVGDEGTIDMVGGFLSNLEKVSWMLDAWLSSRKVTA